MFDPKNIKKELELQGFPVTETDVLYTQGIVAMVTKAQAPLSNFRDLCKEKPLTVVDKEVLTND